MADAEGESPAAEEPEEGDDLENGNDLDEEEEDQGDAADLEGFLAEEGADDGGGGEGGGSSSSSSSGSEADDQDLNEDDLDMLREAGLDVPAAAAVAAAGSGEKRKRDEEEADGLGEEGGEDDEAPPRQRSRAGGLFAAAAAAMGGDGDGDGDDFDDFSIASMDDFVVQDPAAPQRGGEDQDLGITEEQKAEITLIFGDLSVLRPIDAELPDAEMGAMLDEEEEGEEDDDEAAAASSQQPSQGAAGAGESLGAASASASASASQGALLPVVPATGGVSQRWSQTYLAEPSLLDEGGARVWTGTEDEAESEWVYQEAFTERHEVDKKTRLQAIVDVLYYLHQQYLEPAAIAQMDVFFGALTREDIYIIADLDQRWQPVWKSFKDLQTWSKQVNVPVQIDNRIRPRTFAAPRAELHIKDTADWFLTTYPELGGSTSVGSLTPIRRLALEAQKAQLDAQLGLKKAGEGDLSYVSITPQELGDNLYNGAQTHKPNPEATNCEKDQVFEAAGRRMTPSRPPELVEDMVIALLATRLAAEPRVREAVRKEFRGYCAVSTYVTEGGKSMAEEAAWNFRENYRAFHICHRPWSEFADDDALFLDVMDLQRRGFLGLEYSLILPKEHTSKVAHAGACSYIVPGHDEQDITIDRGKLSTHINKTSSQDARGLAESVSVEDIEDFTVYRNLRRRLEAMAKIREVHERLKGRDEKKEQVLFRCASVSLTADELNKMLCLDPIFDGLARKYCQLSDNGQFLEDNPWNRLRKSVVRRALLDELYPLLWAEVQSDLARQAEDYVCRACAANLAKFVDRQPWKPWTKKKLQDASEKEDDGWNNKGWQSWDKMETEEEEDEEDPEIYDPDSKSEKAARMRGYISAFVIVPEILDNFCVMTYVNQFGDPIDARKFFTEFYRGPDKAPEKGSFEEVRGNKRKEHQDIFKQMLKLYQPAVIVFPMVDQTVMRLRNGVEAIVEEVHKAKPFRSKPEILVTDPTIPRLVAFDPRCMEQGAYKDCISPLQRLALSAARYVQDPLAEAAQLWSDNIEENSLLKVRLHRLQGSLPRNRLTRALQRTLVECVAKSGVHVNRLRHTSHMMSVVKFLPGFGSRRLDLFRRCLGSAITSRQDLADRILTTFCSAGICRDEKDCAPVLANCLPFIKIVPDLRDSWSARQTPAFDRTRLSEKFRLWLLNMCQAALDNTSVDEVLLEGLDDSIAKAMRVFDTEQKLKKILDDLITEGKWDWSHMDGVDIPETFHADLLQDLLVAEVLEPYRDQRQPYAPPEGAHLFSLIVAEPEESFAPGTMVYALVKHDGEVPDESGRDAKASVKVDVMPSGVGGNFPKQHKMGEGKGYIEGCERTFRKGEQVLARIVRTMANPDRQPNIALTVDKENEEALRNFPITDDDVRFFIPTANEDWSLQKLGVVGLDEKDEILALRRKIQRPRNIRHPNWFNEGHNEAVKLLHDSPLGHVLFRRSQRHDVIVGMLKVRSTDRAAGMVKPVECYRHFDIFESPDASSPGNGFELCNKLECEGQYYSDLDEIIARHMDPIMDNLRILQEHPRFGLHSNFASVTNKADVISNLEKFSGDNQRMLMYSFILHPQRSGQGMLLWTAGGMKVKEELVEIRPQGFGLWDKTFEKLPQLVKWFKMRGYSEAFERRKKFKEQWKKKEHEIKEKRGKDAMQGMRKKEEVAKEGFDGLNTPGAFNTNPATAIPAAWRAEAHNSGYATPGGLATPGPARR